MKNCQTFKQVAIWMSFTCAFLSGCTQKSALSGIVSQGGATNGSSSLPGTILSSCSFNGQTLASGGTAIGYTSSSMPYGQACISETVSCTNGVLNPMTAFPSCSVLGAPPPVLENIFDCSSFSSTGACGAGRSSFYLLGGGSPAVSGSRILLTNPANSNHVANAMIYQTQVNVQAFTATFTFVPNEWNLAFILENSNNVAGFDENIFQGGAGCEAGFYQAFDNSTPNNIFALELDSRSSLFNENPYTILPPDSTVQIYQQDESPCTLNDDQPNYVYKQKLSTAPVAFNKPLVSASNASLDFDNPTGDTYSATIIYDGSNLTLNLFDVTQHSTCPGSGCYTHTWTSINIPAMVNGNTAWVGLTTGTSQPSSGSNITTDVGPTLYPLYINSFNYSVGK